MLARPHGPPKPATHPAAGFFVSLAVLAVCTHTTPARADGDEWLSKDKALHCTASALIAGAGYGISAPFFHHSRLPPLLIGAGAGVLAGVGKELYDATGRGDPSFKDLTWDGIGITAGLLISVGIDVLIRGWHLAPKDQPVVTSGGYAIRF